MGETISLMVLVVFAVFGVYCFVRLWWENRCIPDGMRVALVLTSREDVRALPDRLTEIYSRLSVPSGTLLVLVPGTLYGDPLLREEIDAFLTGYDAELLVFSKEDGDSEGP